MTPKEFRARKKYKTVHGLRMAYIDEGEGDPIVFLHGNPTSSYLWRNVMPHLAGRGRIIAPDLIGMGDSEKLPDSGPGRYSFAEHKKYLFALLEVLGVNENVRLVIHDWGSALGFHWAHTHQEAVKGIAFMEGIVAVPPSYSSMPEGFARFVQTVKAGGGEEMVIKNNMFIERILPASIMRTLSDEEMNEYRRPYVSEGEDRRPTLTWPQQIPVAGEPADVAEAVSAYGPWLAGSDLPKLFINADPGILLVGKAREYARSWLNLTEVTVKGLHFIQEDSPDDIGRAVANWLPE